MKITSFNPMIISRNAEEAIELFEALGFEKRHAKTNVDEESGDNINSFAMAHPDGFKVDVARADVPQDMPAIRVNVDDFAEACDFLTGRGFTNLTGHVAEDRTSKTALLASPSGFCLNLVQHIKNLDGQP